MLASAIKNKAERAYAERLDRMSIAWERPQFKTFPLDGTSYTPDFFLPESDTFVEIIGTAARWPQIRPKVAAIYRAYPNTRLVVTNKDGEAWPGASREELWSREPEPVDVCIIIKGIPKSLWRRFKVRAAMRGETMRAALLEGLADYIK